MAQLALHRKYRSQTFSDLVGQEHVVRTLRQALAQGRTAQAYLFTGPRGTGKTSAARLLAKGLNCESLREGEPCDECHACRAIAEGSYLDVIEMDAASEAGVDEVREHIVQASEYRPVMGRRKVFIIDEVHDLSSKAFDSLLKTIEEPPEHAVFILATTEFSKVPTTIRSRCQRYEFHRGSITHLIQRLRHVVECEGVEAEPDAVAAIAKMADGGFRDALTLLEQAIISATGPITKAHIEDQLGLVADDEADAILIAIHGQDAAAIMRLTEDLYRRGRDPRGVLEALLHRLADLTRASFGVDAGSEAALEAHAKSIADQLGRRRLLELRSALAAAHLVAREISLPRIWLEAELIRLSLPSEPVGHPAPAHPAPAQPASGPKPPEAAPSSAQEAWDQVCREICAQSKTAQARLPGSRVLQATEKEVVIGMGLVTNVHWANSQAKMGQALRESWARRLGHAPAIRFVALGEGTPMPIEEAPPVELPLEGPRLVDEVRRTLKADEPQDPA